jgi:hypothetical protein
MGVSGACEACGHFELAMFLKNVKNVQIVSQIGDPCSARSSTPIGDPIDQNEAATGQDAHLLPQIKPSISSSPTCCYASFF